MGGAVLFFKCRTGASGQEKVALPVAALGSGIKVLASPTAFVETAGGDSCRTCWLAKCGTKLK